MLKNFITFILVIAILIAPLNRYPGVSAWAAFNDNAIALEVNEAIALTTGALGVSAGDTSDILWNLKRDGIDVPMIGNIEGSLTNSGGTVRFPQTGVYTLIASITDATGRTFSNSHVVSVNTPLNCDFNLSTTNTHIKNSITVTMAASVNTGGKTISWSLTKGGSVSGYTGTLNNSGGNIKVPSTGVYTLTASIVDDLGRTITCSKNFTTYNTAPSKPVITRSPNDSVVNCNDKIRITATASDPDGDSVTLIWENRPAVESTYAVGTHTVRVKAKDTYGLESAWASITFTSALLYESGTTTKATIGYGKYISAPSGRLVTSVELQVPSFAKLDGYNYVIDILYDDTESEYSYYETVFLSGSGYNGKITFAPKKSTYIRITLNILDTAQQNLPVTYKVNFSYP